MRMFLIKYLNLFLGLFGLNIRRNYPSYFDKDAVSTIRSIRPYTMIGTERLYAFIQAVKYVHRCKIDGDIVECGVWRGGAIMAAAKTLHSLGSTDKSFYLYDTFEGMTKPTEKDITYTGETSTEYFEKTKTGEDSSEWCDASIEDVKKNISSLGYDMKNFKFVKGKIEDTVPKTVPNKISILRLDTDWYESTKHEMEQLFPILSIGGVLLVDDYGDWRGCKDAVDEYINKNNIKILLTSVQGSVIGIKQ